MRDLGLLLLLFGIASCFARFWQMDDNRLFHWTNGWGEEASWIIRGVFIVAGATLWKLGKQKPKAKTS